VRQDGWDEPDDQSHDDEGQVRTVAAKKPAKTENDVQRRMREALEAKQAKNKAVHGEDHLSGHGVGGSKSDVTKRQFRRKAGG
jgi:hypothetical protein